MRKSVAIRSAATADLDEVARVWHASASQMDAAASPIPSVNELRSRVDVELASGWELFVAECGPRIVGMLALKPHEAILDQIFVLPADQASGVGSALLEIAKQRMPQAFTLRMAASNLRAARFYEKSGLDPAGDGSHPASGRPVRYYRWKGNLPNV